jgi:hypothetical protein
MKKSELKALILECNKELVEEGDMTAKQINDSVLTETLAELTQQFVESIALKDLAEEVIDQVYPDYALDVAEFTKELAEVVEEDLYVAITGIANKVRK